MMNILVWDNDLRNMWLYNAFRKHIATGEFATLVTTMVTAGVVGTLLFPGAGTLAGMMFGVAGGTISLFIPQDQKDALTEILQALRFGFFISGDDRGPLFHVNRDIIRLMYNSVSVGEPIPSMLVFNPRAGASQQLADVIVEKLFRYDSRLMLLINQKAQAAARGGTQDASDIDGRIQDFVQQTHAELEKLHGLYTSELEELSKILKDYPVLTDDNLVKYPKLSAISEYRKRIQKISLFLGIFVSTYERDMISDTKSYEGALNRFYIFGFNEDQLLKLL
jgi:hypothetical protein